MTEMDRDYLGLSLEQTKRRMFQYECPFFDDYLTLVFSLTACLQRSQHLCVCDKERGFSPGCAGGAKYLLDRGVLSTHLIWMVLSSCTLPGRLPVMVVLGMR